MFKRANVLWAGIAPSRELFDLAARVRTRLTAAGIPFDAGAFTPHITLARKPILPGGALPQIEIPPVGMTVDSVCLYWSHRIKDKLVYTVIGRSGICQEDDT